MRTESDQDSSPNDAECYSTEAKSAWISGDWWYVGIVVEVVDSTGLVLGSASVWGVEEGSIPGVDGWVDPLDGNADYVADLRDEATREAHATAARIAREVLGYVSGVSAC